MKICWPKKGWIAQKTTFLATSYSFCTELLPRPCPCPRRRCLSGWRCPLAWISPAATCRSTARHWTETYSLIMLYNPSVTISTFRDRFSSNSKTGLKSQHLPRYLLIKFCMWFCFLKRRFFQYKFFNIFSVPKILTKPALTNFFWGKTIGFYFLIAKNCKICTIHDRISSVTSVFAPGIINASRRNPRSKLVRIPTYVQKFFPFLLA